MQSLCNVLFRTYDKESSLLIYMYIYIFALSNGCRYTVASFFPDKLDTFFFVGLWRHTHTCRKRNELNWKKSNEGKNNNEKKINTHFMCETWLLPFTRVQSRFIVANVLLDGMKFKLIGENDWNSWRNPFHHLLCRFEYRFSMILHKNRRQHSTIKPLGMLDN